jgi:hypothetical protein
MKFKICQNCGAHNDHGEICDCGRTPEPPRREVAVTTPGHTHTKHRADKPDAPKLHRKPTAGARTIA